MDSNKCPRCNSINTALVDFKQGVIVCSQCGFVLDTEIVDDHNEQRFFSKNISSNGYSNKDLSRTSGPINSFKFGEDNQIQLIGKKTKFNKGNKIFYNNKIKKKDLSEKEQKILKKESDLNKIDYELKKLCTYFNIQKDIYEETKKELIKLYEYGKINIRSSNWKLILGLVLNYILKIKTNICFSKEDLINYFRCEIESLKKEANNIYPFLTNNSPIIQSKEEKKDINLNSENNLDKYFTQLQQDIYNLIKRTKISTLTGITDSYDIISIYIKNNIFNIEGIPTLCLAGGALIFCIKLYDIEFIVTYKSKDKLDESYNMKNLEEEKKLINYISKKCGTGINKDKLNSVYQKMIKYKNVLNNSEKYKVFLDSISNGIEKDNHY